MLILSYLSCPLHFVLANVLCTYVYDLNRFIAELGMLPLPYYSCYPFLGVKYR
jgi:hypothetical protein